MAFHGLFVGIDRHAADAVPELSCAGRDATALQALFADNLGESATLLVDEQATTAAVRAAIEGLCHGTQADDVVVIGFSGHGTENHRLVTYDTNPGEIAASSIGLDEVHDLFARIPARLVVLLLDCCFSGGIGAKVLQTGVRSRGSSDRESVLDRMAGEGRVIIAASAADQPAYENATVGHGLLTHFLLLALQGPEEIREGKTMSVLRLLDYVSGSVVHRASALGVVQRPVVLGNVQGRLTWPVFSRGASYAAAFPERALPPVGPDLSDLRAYDFPNSILSAWAGAIPGLNELQISAINEFGILSGKHVLVSAPTSSGKTMIGELAAIKGALSRKKSLFLLPLKALVYDKEREFQETYGSFGIRVVAATGETDDVRPLLNGRYDICLLTYEKFSALILGNPHLLDQVGTVVIDEVQMVADSSRGANLEFVLTLLRMRRQQGIEPQVVALSAVLGDTNGLELWLGGRLLKRTERPVPLKEGVLTAEGSFRYLHPETNAECVESGFVRATWRKGSSQDWVIPLVGRLVGEGKQVIVFRETKGETRGCARYLADSLGLPSAARVIDALPEGDPSATSQELRRALAAGVAFHNADLDIEERRAIEEEFRRDDSVVRVIVATTTLAMGVNTPASAVVVVGLMHPGDTPYTVAEYKNLAGRAGRLGYAETGESYLVATDPRTEFEYWDHYVNGLPEPVDSRFLDDATDPRTLIVRTLSGLRPFAAQGVPRDDVVAFLENSFGVFVQRRNAPAWSWSRDDLDRSLHELLAEGLVCESSERLLTLTKLGTLAGEGGIEVGSLIRVVRSARRLSSDEINGPTLVALCQLTRELDQMPFPLNSRSKHKEPETWPQELKRNGVPWPVLSDLAMYVETDQQGTARAKKAVACLLYVSELPLAEIERVLTQFGGGLGGAAGPIRAVADRTSDVLPVVARAVAEVHPGLEVTEQVDRLATRIQHGLPPEVGELGSSLGRTLARGDYLNLRDGRLVSLNALAAAPDSAILACLGQDHRKLEAIRDAIDRLEREASTSVGAGPLPTFQP